METSSARVNAGFMSSSLWKFQQKYKTFLNFEPTIVLGNNRPKFICQPMKNDAISTLPLKILKKLITGNQYRTLDALCYNYNKRKVHWQHPKFYIYNPTEQAFKEASDGTYSSATKSNWFTPCLASKQSKRHPRHQEKGLEEGQMAPVSGYCTTWYLKAKRGWMFWLEFHGNWSTKIWNIPNTQANKKADPNPTASPAAIVSGDCIR